MCGIRCEGSGEDQAQRTGPPRETVARPEATVAGWVRCGARCRRKRKKADVAEHPGAFHHVGLPVNGPPGPAGLSFIWSSDNLESSFGRVERESSSRPFEVALSCA